MKCHTAEHARLNDDMFFYRQLRGQQRIQLHVCLFLSFLLTALLSLLWQLLIYNDRVENPWIETFMVKQQVRLIWLLDDVLFINCLGMGNEFHFNFYSNFIFNFNFNLSFNFNFNLSFNFYFNLSFIFYFNLSFNFNFNLSSNFYFNFNFNLSFNSILIQFNSIQLNSIQLNSTQFNSNRRFGPHQTKSFPVTPGLGLLKK